MLRCRPAPSNLDRRAKEYRAWENSFRYVEIDLGSRLAEEQRNIGMGYDWRMIPFDWARVSCPKCGAGPDERCRTLTTNRPTDAHEQRRQLAEVHRT